MAKHGCVRTKLHQRMPVIRASAIEDAANQTVALGTMVGFLSNLSTTLKVTALQMPNTVVGLRVRLEEGVSLTTY